MFAHRYRYLFVIILGGYSYINTVFSEALKYYGINGNAFLVAGSFILICLLIWEGNRLLESFLEKAEDKKSKVHPLLLFFIASHAVTFVAALISYIIIATWVLEKDVVQTMVPAKLVFIFSFRINLFLNCIHAIFFLLNQYRKKELEAEEFRRISAMASLQAIRNQVNPHFLFNNLNVLSTLVMQKNEEANTFIEKFSAVYRYILKNQDTELILLKSELDFIHPYIFLLEKRFGNGLQVQIDVPAAYDGMYIVPVALQMLVENAIKHNIVSAKRPLHVLITVNNEGQLVVKNNLQLRENREPSEQIGLQNINKRLKIVAGKEIRVEKDEDSFAVAIPLLNLEHA
jgi:two-component system, LytTR family, sensor kinase